MLLHVYSHLYFVLYIIKLYMIVNAKGGGCELHVTLGSAQGAATAYHVTRHTILTHETERPVDFDVEGA